MGARGAIWAHIQIARLYFPAGRQLWSTRLAKRFSLGDLRPNPPNTLIYCCNQPLGWKGTLTTSTYFFVPMVMCDGDGAFGHAYAQFVLWLEWIG